MQLWLVDAFTHEQFKGNPAGICLVDSFPSTPLMQNIAAEMNWSQTAFVMQKSESRFHIRWFSPRDEAPLCGHATLAASHLIWQQQRSQEPLLTFESLAGELYAQRESESWIGMEFPLHPVSACSLPDLLREALGGVAVQSVYKDERVYMVVLRDAQDVAKLNPNLSLIEKIDCRAVIVTAAGEGGYDFVSRYFAPKVGIPEDPVCGSAHCRLVPYWAKIFNKESMLAYQASPRGGVLRVSLKTDKVTLSGQAVTVCVGNLRVNV